MWKSRERRARSLKLWSAAPSRAKMRWCTRPRSARTRRLCMVRGGVALLVAARRRWGRREATEVHTGGLQTRVVAPRYPEQTLGHTLPTEYPEPDSLETSTSTRVRRSDLDAATLVARRASAPSGLSGGEDGRWRPRPDGRSFEFLTAGSPAVIASANPPRLAPSASSSDWIRSRRSRSTRCERRPPTGTGRAAAVQQPFRTPSRRRVTHGAAPATRRSRGHGTAAIRRRSPSSRGVFAAARPRARHTPW